MDVEDRESLLGGRKSGAWVNGIPKEKPVLGRGHPRTPTARVHHCQSGECDMWAVHTVAWSSLASCASQAGIGIW